MYQIRKNRQKQRLYISLGGNNGADTAAMVVEADRACRELGADFTCLIHFQPGALLLPAQAADVYRLQEMLCSRGIKKAVYVRPEGSVIGRFQLQMLHIHSECPGEDACSIEEGEAILDRG